MRIAQLTFHCALNYGAVLQTYALGRVLRELGHSVVLVNLRPPDVVGPRTLHPAALLQRWKFRRFVLTHCPPMTRAYHNPGTVALAAPPADAWVVGSDQVWNPEITGPFAPDYFLEGVRPPTGKVAYAASFGTDALSWGEMLGQRARAWLSEFDGISVREKSGRALCRELGVTDAEQTLDPTLLWGNFRELMPAKLPERQDLLCMLFQPGPEMNASVRRMAEKLSLSPLLLCRRAGDTKFRCLPHPGVEAWVTRFRTSRFVLTDSFHGLAFALLFEKPFAVVPANIRRFHRIRELLEMLGQQNRIFESYTDLQQRMDWCDPVPYGEVHRLLASHRARSLDFLRRVLGAISARGKASQ